MCTSIPPKEILKFLLPGGGILFGEERGILFGSTFLRQPFLSVPWKPFWGGVHYPLSKFQRCPQPQKDWEYLNYMDRRLLCSVNHAIHMNEFPSLVLISYIAGGGTNVQDKELS